MNKTNQPSLITKNCRDFFNGEEALVFTLKNESVEIDITNYGCTILSIKTPDKNGVSKNIVAGFKTINEYKNNHYYFGCIVGRYANRIANGTFKTGYETYNLSINDGKNNLHGGKNGFNKKVWNVDKLLLSEAEAGIRFSYMSKDYEEGFPGNLKSVVTYLLNDKNELVIQYKATTDKATPVSLTNHSYFNLSGFEDDSVYNHSLTINAAEFTEKNEYNQPTGAFLNVDNTVFDFRSAKKIGASINNEVLQHDRGYDHNFVIKHNNSDSLIHAATLADEASGRTMNVFTTAAGIQLYTANFWDGSIIGSQNKAYKQHSAMALETQAFPDSPNHPNFPNTILQPGKEYTSKTIYAFGLSH